MRCDHYVWHDSRRWRCDRVRVHRKHSAAININVQLPGQLGNKQLNTRIEWEV